MKVTIMRFARYHHAVSGKLLIDGQLVCGTLENADRMLPVGDYELGHDPRRLTTPFYIKGNASSKNASGKNASGKNASGKNASSKNASSEKPSVGDRGKYLKRVLLSPGNGVEGRKKQGRILLGETLYLGFLVHSQEAYEQVTDRLRMQLQQRNCAVAVLIRQSEDYFEVA